MKFKNLLFISSLSLAGIFTLSCTDLKEELRGDLTKEQADQFVTVENLLVSAYAGMNTFQSQERIWSGQQHTTDETMCPTRGGDWDDNGIWRSLHAHTWTADHAFLTSSFSELLQVVYTTTNILQFDASPSQAAEARFLRAYCMWTVLDGWGQVPFREAGTSLLADAKVLKADEAVAFLLKEMDEIEADLPDAPTNRANKDAAKVLRMRLLLNKGAYLNRETPSFDAAEMNRVIAEADKIIGNAKYKLSDNYFSNFEAKNDVLSTENIWTAKNVGGVKSGPVRSRWMSTLHYNQNPSGWNGFTTLGDFYDKFESGDKRLTASYPTMTDVSGIKAGLLLGQQLDENGVALQDRKGNPLSFTKEVKIKESGDNLEITGIRVIKYPIDYVSGDNSDNDYVYARLADVMLYKAEALLRTGKAAEGLAIVNTIRAKRGASDFASLTLDNLLDERGRELYWEGHRRTDLIRFGKFLNAWQEKPASGKERLLFPIPTLSLASNPNLIQNPGY